MRAARILGLVALLLCGAGCGRHVAVSQVSATDNGAGSAQTPSIGSAHLRMLGTDAGDFLSARLRVKAVEVRAAGKMLASAVATPVMELTESQNAWLLSQFNVPEGADEVQFHVSFAGGSFDTSGASGDVDTGCADITISANVKKLMQRNRAVLQLDLSRSLLQASSGMMLVPQVLLQY